MSEKSIDKPRRVVPDIQGNLNECFNRVNELFKLVKVLKCSMVAEAEPPDCGAEEVPKPVFRQLEGDAENLRIRLTVLAETLHNHLELLLGDI